MNQHTRDTDFRDPDVGFTPADSSTEVSREIRSADEHHQDGARDHQDAAQAAPGVAGT